MSRCQRECHRFEPDILLQHAAIALAVERSLGKTEVMSSNLIGSTNFRPLVKWISCLSSKQAVGVRSSQGRPIKNTKRCHRKIQ